MTPSECRPGMVVQWTDPDGDVSFGVIHRIADGPVNAPNQHLSAPPSDTCIVLLRHLSAENGDTFEQGMASPKALELAPRFFSENEWHVEMPTSFELQGSVQWRDGWKWWVAGTDSTLVSAPTYLAARQAVERACGIERTE